MSSLLWLLLFTIHEINTSALFHSSLFWGEVAHIPQIHHYNYSLESMKLFYNSNSEQVRSVVQENNTVLKAKRTRF